MNEQYFEWLLNRIGIETGENGYRGLCQILYQHPFYPIVEMDANRCEDGEAYRDLFATNDNARWALDQDIGGCTVLEMMLALAEKTSFDMCGSSFQASPAKWFMEMLENAGLDIYTDSILQSDPDAYYEACDVLERVIFRQYSWNGQGGFFPLQNSVENQRDVEIEIQRNNYLMEHYDIYGS